MRTFDPSTSDFTPVGMVTVARWEQFGVPSGTMPFDSMWYTVPAGGSSPRDQHPELELSIVLTGVAQVEASGRLTEVSTGQAFLLNSEEGHIVHNRTDEPLLVFSAYWMPVEADAPAQTDVPAQTNVLAAAGAAANGEADGPVPTGLESAGV